MAALADPGVDLLIQSAIVADGAAKVLEVDHRLEPGTLVEMDGGGAVEAGAGWNSTSSVAETVGEDKKLGDYYKLIHD